MAMTPEHVRQIVAGGENFTTEFKRARNLNDTEIINAVVCQANGRGGLLLLGVEDSGEITGLPPRHGDRTDPDRLRAVILNNTEPAVATTVELVQIDGVEVAVIEIEAATSPVGSKAGLYLRRSTRVDGSPECIPYRAHEIVSRGLSAQGRDYAETPARGLTLDDLDPREFDRFRELSAGGKGDRQLAKLSDEDILRALRLYRPGSDELTLGAVLLFGRESALTTHVPTAETLFQEMRDGRVVTNEVIRAPLLRTAERIRDLIDVRNTEQELMVGLFRVGIPRLPGGAIREAVANALVHRDYTELGPISVRLAEDDLRVASPGGFPPGITMSNFLDDSRPRSVILVDAFKRAGIVDRIGRGIPEMYTQLIRLGRSGPDYSATNDETVIVSLPASSADLEMVRFVVEYEESAGKSLPLEHLRILWELKVGGPASLTELQVSLGVPVPRLRQATARLSEAGLVEKRGGSRSRRIHLTAAFYGTARASEYVRLLDTAPIQQDQMVLAYVDQWGSITRGKVAELCRLGSEQARTVLRRLVTSGELELRGQRRGAHYVRPENPPRNATAATRDEP